MTTSEASPPESPFSPRNFLRAKRPERFSDSKVLRQPRLERPFLEYHLDTITSRSQEVVFEEFARQLLEKEICPNLLPHTGPTGGGDSKVDSETFPVASSISASWLVGHAENAGNERWAFAISANKKWRTKIRADVASIMGTKRGYTRIFFVSSRFIKDKDRAAEESTLSASCGFDVRIFDRTWILDRVFGNRREALAVAALKLGIAAEEHTEIGPTDLQRERDLTVLEAAIAAGLSDGQSLAVVDDCLEAATIARSLDRPRLEVDGHFARAKRIAREHGTVRQQVTAHYEHAWTAFWWFEDFSLFLEEYAALERLISDSSNIADAESLSNLWTVLAASVKHGTVQADAPQLERRTGDLSAMLERLRSHVDRPSVSLQARALQATMRLVSAAPEVPEEALRELKVVVDESAGLIGFPLLSLSDLLMDLLPHLIKSDAFAALFDAITAAVSKREGEVAGATMLLQKASAELRADRPYEALRTIGPALSALYKYETRRDMAVALFLCARTYERVGLLWAARGALLHAASIAANEWWKHSVIHPALIRAVHGLKWVEVQLGRVPQVLGWHETDLKLQYMASGKAAVSKTKAKRESDFDAILAILLLRADIWQLRDMRRLPDSLAELGLSTATLALGFALGHDDAFELNGETVGPEEQKRDFMRLAAMPVSDDLPPVLILGHERTVTLRTIVLGSVISVVADNRIHCIMLAEILLAAIEGLLATAILESVIPLGSRIECRVAHSDFATSPFTFEMSDKDGHLVLQIRCPAPPADQSVSDHQTALKEALFSLLAQLVTRGFMIRDAEVLETLIGKERAMQRAIDFSTGFGAVYNVLGATPRLGLEDWTPGENQEYELRRTEVWDADERRRRNADSPIPTVRGGLASDSEPPPVNAPDLRGVKHSNIGFESLIRIPLWDAAEWTAIGWASAADSVPWMILGFRNQEPAAAILKNLVGDVGKDDPQNRLRVTIIRGIDRDNPAHYRVIIGSNPAVETFDKIGATVSRVHTMTPTSSQNLDRFIEAYRESGRFALAVGLFATSSSFPSPVGDGYVLKEQLIVREAWEIGFNDLDAAGVQPDDNVRIPDERQADAPILALQKWRSKQRR